MNNVNPERKEGTLKTLAIFGLIGIIIFLAWLSVQIVNIFPQAVSSLASLADTVYNYNSQAEELELNPIEGPVISGNEIMVSWDKNMETGTYTFSYECAEGVSVEIKSGNVDFQNAECDTVYDLGSVDNTSLKISSEKNPAIDFHYHISYFKTNATEESLRESGSITITNPRLTAAEDTEAEEVAPEETEVVTKPKPETPTTPTKPVVSTPIYEYTYTIPVSNPNGFTDLKVTYLGIGRTNNDNDFINTGVLEEGQEGAILFSIHNVGTKTSERWDFEAILPSGQKYESEDNAPLKPNEKATVTISFGAIHDTGRQTFSVEIDTDNDINTNNNEFNWSTNVVN